MTACPLVTPLCGSGWEDVKIYLLMNTLLPIWGWGYFCCCCLCLLSFSPFVVVVLFVTNSNIWILKPPPIHCTYMYAMHQHQSDTILWNIPHLQAQSKPHCALLLCCSNAMATINLCRKARTSPIWCSHHSTDNSQRGLHNGRIIHSSAI